MEIDNVQETPSEDQQLDLIMQEAEGTQVQPAEIVDNPEVAKTTEQTDPMDALYEYKASGQTVKEPLKQILQRASMGYHYAQQMAEFNKTKSEFEAKQKEFSPKMQMYEQVDQWATENPDLWQNILQNYQQRNQPQDLDPMVKEALSPLQTQLQQLTDFMQDFQANQQVQKQQAEDDALGKEIDQVKDQYKDLDWASADETGKTLEMKVLEYADQNSIPSFRAAFSDFYLPKLLSRERERGKQEAAKRVQKNSKLGIIGISPTPKNSQKVDHSQLNYNQLAEMALAETEQQQGA